MLIKPALTHVATSRSSCEMKAAVVFFLVQVAAFVPSVDELDRRQGLGLFAKKKKKGKAERPASKRPRLVVFDLDGCLWRPELYEIQTSPVDNQGSPFTFNKKDEVPGTTLKSAGGVHTLELLGDTRTILEELYYSETWYPTLVGISSRTHPSEWAYEILSKISIHDTSGSGSSNRQPFPMMDVFTPALCILDRDMDKYEQFEIILERANTVLPTSDRIQFKDIIFYDNEAGNCKQVAKLGVTCVYTPRGLTREAWENGLAEFPCSRGVLGPKLPY